MKIIPNKIKGEIVVPSSKSVLHRLIILSSIATEPTTIICNDFGNDIVRTIDCIRALGGKIEVFNDKIKVYPIQNPTNNAVLNVGESGSTLRFLLPVVCSLGLTTTFIGEPSIISRPLQPILDLLTNKGIFVSNNKLPLTVSGNLQSGDYVIDGSLSSQFATGLLIALANVSQNSTLKILNATSNDYINITLDCLKLFNVDVIKRDNNSTVCTNNANNIGSKTIDTYIINSSIITSPKSVVAEGDWSSACFLISLGVLLGEVSLKNLNIDSSQGDKVILDIISKMGGKISTTNDTIVVSKSKLKGIEFSIKDCPDIAPILSVIMANAMGKSVLYDVDRLKIKESDRLQNIIDMLQKLGIQVEYKTDSLTIFGGSMNSTSLEGKNDHRIAISSIVALSVVGGSISGIKCIDKSYPTFLDDYKKLGGIYE